MILKNIELTEFEIERLRCGSKITMLGTIKGQHGKLTLTFESD